jgi:hypothetical protein
MLPSAETAASINPHPDGCERGVQTGAAIDDQVFVPAQSSPDGVADNRSRPACQRAERLHDEITADTTLMSPPDQLTSSYQRLGPKFPTTLATQLAELLSTLFR